MSRLTFRLPNGYVGHTTEVGTGDLARRLCDYEDKEEQGLLIELPCKVGDTFWELSWSNDSVYPRVAHSLQHCCYVKDRLGTWCFLTQAEAEEALAKMGGK